MELVSTPARSSSAWARYRCRVKQASSHPIPDAPLPSAARHLPLIVTIPPLLHRSALATVG